MMEEEKEILWNQRAISIPIFRFRLIPTVVNVWSLVPMALEDNAVSS